MFSPHTLIKDIFIITSYFVLLITSSITNITTANSPITTSVNWVMNCARNTIFPSSFRVPSVAENTKNGSPTRMVLRGKRRSERTSISASSRLPLTKNFCFWWEPKGMKSKGKLLKKELPNTSHSALWIKSVFVRGSTRSLGKEYTKERIKERIERKRERKAVIPKRDYSAHRLIDTSDEKFRSSPGLQRWAAIENLKIAATEL